MRVKKKEKKRERKKKEQTTMYNNGEHLSGKVCISESREHERSWKAGGGWGVVLEGYRAKGLTINATRVLHQKHEPCSNWI